MSFLDHDALAGALAGVDSAQGEPGKFGLGPEHELAALRDLAEAVRVHLGAKPQLADDFTADELDALVTTAVELWENTDDAVDYLNAGQRAVLDKARTVVMEDWGVTS